MVKEDFCQTVGSLLDAFVRDNFTGPPADDTCSEKGKVLETLEIDGESPYHLVINPQNLVKALDMLKESAAKEEEEEEEEDDPKRLMLALKAKFLHQRILDNWSGTLAGELYGLCDRIEELLLKRGEKSMFLASFYVQKGLILHFYQKEKQSKVCFEKAQEISGLSWSLTGVLGKRTKFQGRDISQLVVKANSCSTSSSSSSSSCSSSSSSKEVATDLADGKEVATTLPAQVDLNSDVLLEKMKLTSTHQPEEDMISPFDACLLLAFCLHFKASNPNDELTANQMLPYVTRVLDNSKHSGWNVHTLALLIRSRLEMKKSKTVERAVLQLQALVDQYSTNSDGEGSNNARLEFFDELAVPTIWELKVELGKSLMSLGVLRSAQEVFERLEMWNLVLDCMNLLGRRNDAEKLILRLLQAKPDDPKLVCYLADVRSDPSLYEKSWELSGQRYSRAMRSLGHHYFEKGQYEKCVSCLEKALKINTMFDSSWFTMGCAAMFCKDWEVAEKAFRNVIYIKPEDGQAWSNLASVHLRKGGSEEELKGEGEEEEQATKRKLERLVNAHRCLKEGVKANAENWRIWDNFLSISLQLGFLSDCLVAFHRILDMKNTLDYAVSMDMCSIFSLIFG